MEAIYSPFKKVVDLLVKLECWVGIVLFGLTGIIMASQIFMRRILNLPFIWAEDLTVFLFVWMTFLERQFCTIVRQSSPLIAL